MSHEPIQRRKLYEEVFDRLLERIRNGEIQPGEQLPSERELMDFYAVGRPAVREALQSLALAGLVTISHGERARAALPTAESVVAQVTRGTELLLRMDPGSLHHFMEVRVLLEGGVARLAAEKADAKGLAILRERLDDHHRVSSQSQHFLDGDLGFHRQIAAISGNPIFPVVVDAMLRWLAEYYQSLVRAPGAESLTLTEHERIFEAIARHDGAGAEIAMREHLTRANALYENLVRRDDSPLRAGDEPQH
jgi:GntR family transcriptional regulator, sialic acid-inducible nan operon repressor